jgi:hypothetical protein
MPSLPALGCAARGSGTRHGLASTLTWQTQNRDGRSLPVRHRLPGRKQPRSFVRRQPLPAAQPGERRSMREIEPRTDLVALHDALDSARSAAWAAEGGDRDAASMALMEASAASASAFAAGSREAEALSVIFTAIGRAVPGLDELQVSGPELGD